MLGLKYNLNFVFLLVLNFFKRGFRSRVGYNFSTIFFEGRIKSLICMDVLWLTLNMREAFLQYASLHPSFSYKHHFYKQARMKLAKSQVNAKQHPEAELLASENYWHSSSTLSSNNDRTYSRK